MSKGTKIIVVAIIVIVLAVIWYWFSSQKPNTNIPAITQTGAVQQSVQTPAPEVPKTTAEEDAISFDAQLQGVSASTASIDAALNDKQIK
ncbi:MAG: hypothetical protein EXS50_03650 [Candidatus Taylorbacteria bacterium]|nr:hypothetical protein [Candidatus Taylorbacteria bacterium]